MRSNFVPMKQGNIYNGSKKGNEKIKGVGVKSYVDRDFFEYLKKRAERTEMEQEGVSGYEGMTNVPDGIYVIGFEDYEGKYGNIAPLKTLMDDAEIDIDFIVPIGPGMYMREGLINRRDEILCGLEP